MRFELLPTQRELFEVPHDEPTDLALYQGGVGSGKTTAGVLLGYTLATLYPGSRGLVGAATHTLLRDTTRARWAEIVPRRDIARWTADPDNLVLRNGSQVWFRHLSSPERLASMEFSWIHVEEGSQVSERVFRALLARLRYNRFQSPPGLARRYRLFITSNPEESYGYLHKAFIAPETARANWRYIRAPTTENRFLMAHKPDYVDLIRQTVDDEYYRIFVEGETGGGAEGRVYRNFDRAQHVDKQVQYDPDRSLHLSFDFNVDFMVALAIQKRPDDVTWVVDEVVIRHGSDTDALCVAILERFAGQRASIVVHGDASGHARDHRGGRSDYAIIRERLKTLPGVKLSIKRRRSNPLVRERTNAVNFRLQNSAGKKRLFVAPHCRYLIRSLEHTKFVPGRFEKEKVRDPKDPRFVIDHPGDALDYFIGDEYPFKREKLGVVSYR